MVHLLRISRVVDALNRTFGVAVGWLILVMTIVSAFNATSWNLFSVTSNAFLEIQWYLFAAVFVLATGYTLLSNEHVRDDVLNARLPARVRLLVEPVCTLLFLYPMTLLAIPFSGSSGWCSSAAAWRISNCPSSSGHGTNAALYMRIALRPAQHEAQ